MLRHRYVWYEFTNFWINILFPYSGRNVAQGVCLLNFIKVYLTTWTQNLEAAYIKFLLTNLHTCYLLIYLLTYLLTYSVEHSPS